MFTFNARNLIAAAALAAAASSGWAATVSLNPSANQVVVGQGFDVELLISDLGTSQQLGAFDLQLNFDPSVFSFGSYSLGSALGSLASFEAFDLSMGDLGGSVHLGEVSFLWDLSSQAQSFSLGTLHFTANAVGSSTLGLSNVTLGDAFGTPIAANLGGNAMVSAVPEPASYALMLVGLGALGAAARRRQQG